MKLKKLHDPANGQMRIAGFLSGSGTNMRKILDLERSLEKTDEGSPYKVVVLLTENHKSKAALIGAEYGIRVVTRDLEQYYALRQKPRKDMIVRREFDAETASLLQPYEATVAAYAGYMSIVTQPLIDAYIGVNVHPADLSIMHGEARAYTGAHAVRDAILAGEPYLRSTTHLVEQLVDCGRILMISPPVESIVPENFDHHEEEVVMRVANENQERLKQEGDWVIFPLTLLYLAMGRYARDDRGLLHFDGESITAGLKLEKDL